MIESSKVRHVGNFVAYIPGAWSYLYNKLHFGHQISKTIFLEQLVNKKYKSFQATKSNSLFTFIYDNVIKTWIQVIHIQSSKKAFINSKQAEERQNHSQKRVIIMLQCQIQTGEYLLVCCYVCCKFLRTIKNLNFKSKQNNMKRQTQVRKFLLIKIWWLSRFSKLLRSLVCSVRSVLWKVQPFFWTIL